VGAPSTWWRPDCLAGHIGLEPANPAASSNWIYVTTSFKVGAIKVAETLRASSCMMPVCSSA
jgi:hypothetical protein